VVNLSEAQQKRLLIAGGGYAEIPLIEAGKGLGYYVITSGNRPEDLGHRVSDEYCPADFSDQEAMLTLARNKAVDVICPCANDFSALSCAYVAEKMGLPGHDPVRTSEVIHHKDRYRAFALENDIPSPGASGFSGMQAAMDALDRFQLPLIIKPVDLTGGKGISTVEHLSRAKEALAKAFSISRAGRVVVEEFIEGSRHGFSAFICNGKVVFHFLDNENYYLNPYMVSAASTPAQVSNSVVRDLIRQSEKIAGLLALGDGLFHVQFILKDSQATILEICRRPPGDFYIKLVEHATGLDYSSWIIKAFAGLDCSMITQREVKGFYLRHCIMADRNGLITDIKFSPEIKTNLFESFMWWRAGDRINDYLVDKCGIVFLKFSSMDEMLSKANNMQELIKVKLQ
jgi:biotin carboxylase